jgi:hypothetical protein
MDRGTDAGVNRSGIVKQSTHNALQELFVGLRCKRGSIDRSFLSSGVGIVGWCVKGRSVGSFDAIGPDACQQLAYVPRHGEGDISLLPVDLDVHTKVLGALPVDLDLV